MFLEIAGFMAQLAPSITLNVTDYDSMKREFIGIGSSKTWHGFPDALIDSAPLYYIREECDGSDSDSAETWGGKVTCEAKQSFKGNFFDQVLGHAVVSSVIHFNRHPSQNAGFCRFLPAQ